MNKILESIRARPGRYFDGNDCPFACLTSFLGGYQAGFAAAKDGNAAPEELVSYEFQKFVTEKFGRHFPAGGMGWETFIKQYTSSEREAFDLFFVLRGEYDQKQSGK